MAEGKGQFQVDVKQRETAEAITLTYAREFLKLDTDGKKVAVITLAKLLGTEMARITNELREGAKP